MLSTNVKVEHFLAKNLQINIIRNSFDTLGVLTEKVFGNKATQRTTEKKLTTEYTTLKISVALNLNLCGSLCNLYSYK